MNEETYLNEFLKLKCCGDILNIVNPVQRIEKEISEAMGLLKIIKKIALKDPMKYTLYDFCAGNALISVTAVHLLPIKYAYAIDKRKRNRNWEKVKRFEYVGEQKPE